MSRKDRIKAKLDLLKLLIVAFLTALFGVVSFTALNYKNFDLLLTVLVLLGTFSLIIALAYFVKDFNRHLDELEKEK